MPSTLPLHRANGHLCTDPRTAAGKPVSGRHTCSVTPPSPAPSRGPRPRRPAAPASSASPFPSATWRPTSPCASPTSPASPHAPLTGSTPSRPGAESTAQAETAKRTRADPPAQAELMMKARTFERTQRCAECASQNCETNGPPRRSPRRHGPRFWQRHDHPGNCRASTGRGSRYPARCLVPCHAAALAARSSSRPRTCTSCTRHTRHPAEDVSIEPRSALDHEPDRGVRPAAAGPYPAIRPQSSMASCGGAILADEIAGNFMEVGGSMQMEVAPGESGATSIKCLSYRLWGRARGPSSRCRPACSCRTGECGPSRT